jgi:hypothetical protein
LWFPAVILTDVVGLLKSLVFAVAVIVAPGWLSKNWVRLKLWDDLMAIQRTLLWETLWAIGVTSTN